MGDAGGHRGFGSLVCRGTGSVITEAGAALVVHDRIGELGRAVVPHALRVLVPDLCGLGPGCALDAGVPQAASKIVAVTIKTALVMARCRCARWGRTLRTGPSRQP